MKNIYRVTLRVDETKLLQSFGSHSSKMIQQAIVEAIEQDKEAGIEVDSIRLNNRAIACENCNTTIRIGEKTLSIGHKFYCSIFCLHNGVDYTTRELTEDDIVRE